jgi:glucosamine--fructose-6-phosphate aminotransferase (isomerizing)
VLAVATSGEVASGMRDLLRRLRDDHDVDIVAISDVPEGLAANAVLPVPTAPAPWLQPIVSAVPAQLFAAHLARARGLDPDAPFHIRKVTRTR